MRRRCNGHRRELRRNDCTAIQQLSRSILRNPLLLPVHAPCRALRQFRWRFSCVSGQTPSGRGPHHAQASTRLHEEAAHPAHSGATATTAGPRSGASKASTDLQPGGKNRCAELPARSARTRASRRRWRQGPTASPTSPTPPAHGRARRECDRLIFARGFDGATIVTSLKRRAAPSLRSDLLRPTARRKTHQPDKAQLASDRTA